MNTCQDRQLSISEIEFNPVLLGFVVSTKGCNKGRHTVGENKTYLSIAKEKDGKLRYVIRLNEKDTAAVIAKLGDRVDVSVNPTNGFICISSGTSRKLALPGGSDGNDCMRRTINATILGPVLEKHYALKQTVLTMSQLGDAAFVLAPVKQN